MTGVLVLLGFVALIVATTACAWRLTARIARGEFR